MERPEQASDARPPQSEQGTADAFDAAMPCARDLRPLAAEPMACLERWRHALGDLYRLDLSGPLLTRGEDCPGVVVVHGEAHQRAVLTDIERFVLPESAARTLGLPPALRTLNTGLHGMRGAGHERDKQLLARVLAAVDADAMRSAIAPAIQAIAGRLRAGAGALSAMRALTFEASSRLLFGTAGSATVGPERLMAYFQLRREAAAPGREIDAATRTRLIALGEAVDAGLRGYRRQLRAVPTVDADHGALAALALADDIGEDAFVGHANVLFISCNEPVAVALTWTLLAISQLPALQTRLRAEAKATGHDDGRSVPSTSLSESSLLKSVLSESLRVLTPNALMVRVVREPVVLGGYRLPAGCEVLLCPFLSHRDPQWFPQPQRFSPSRWAGLRPSAYTYFPFGAGGHGCVGRALALHMLHAALSGLLREGEVVLDGDADVDWRVQVMLMPTVDPMLRMHDESPTKRGMLHGGIAGIVALSDEWC